jgi:hypothetical protein
MNKRTLARVAVFAAAALLGVVSAFLGSNGDSESSHVSTAVSAAPAQ